jgi:uncharacterized cofD-like protein
MAENNKVWHQKLLQIIRQEVRWLIPGVGIKRWVAMAILGTTLLGLGFAMVLLDVYRTAPETWWLKAVSFLYLNFLQRDLRVVVFAGLGLGLMIVGIWGLNRTLLRPFMRPGKPILDAVTAHRRRDRGPRVVALGGGNGLSSLLRGLKGHTYNLTAVVTVADDGGSSGELRKSTGILPPGDIRNCLAALSEDEALLTQLFQYRFVSGSGLNGHSLGNLLITALADITGSFEEAIAESGRVLAVRGRVLPATLHDVRLLADVRQGDQETAILVKGESQIPKAEGKVTRVWMEPDAPAAFPPAVQAILSADVIVVGPGSLYTSIIPNLLVPDLAAAMKASRALKIYICNVATQPGETDGYRAGDHIRTVEEYIGKGFFDLVVCNKSYGSQYSTQVSWVEPEPDLDQTYPVYMADLLDEVNPWRHDSKKLGQVVMDLYYERTGPQNGRDDAVV